MKQIIIFLLLVILCIIGYGQYKQYKRFSLENYQYKPSEKIDHTYYDKSELYDYYEAIEQLNNHIIMEWSANGIDVRNPKNDDASTHKAMTDYANKLARVDYLEDRLTHSKFLKEKGLTNEDIRLLHQKGINQKELEKEKHRQMLSAMLVNSSNLSLGQSNALVHAVQKLLVNKGYNIPVDGVYENITADAIKAFEVKQNLFADGKLDQLTLEELMK